MESGGDSLSGHAPRGTSFNHSLRQRSSPFHPRASGYRRNRLARLSPDRLGHPASRHNDDTANTFIEFRCTILPGAVQLIGSYT